MDYFLEIRFNWEFSSIETFMKMNVYIVNFRYDLIILGSLPLNIVQEIFIWDDGLSENRSQ